MNPIIVIACGCVLPILSIWFDTRRKMNESRNRTQIVLAALEKNPDMDVEELMKKIEPRRKLLKEKLLSKLLWGCIIGFIGLVTSGYGLYCICTLGTNDAFASGDVSMDVARHIQAEDGAYMDLAFGLILLAIGVAFLVNYFVGKRMLAKEIEAEQKKLTQAE